MQFKLRYRPPHEGNGHKLFTDDQGRVVICDWSGDRPDQTDDGPLIVVTDQPVIVSVWRDAPVYIVTVWVHREQREGRVWMDEATVKQLRHLAPIRFQSDQKFDRFAKSVIFARNLTLA